MKNKKIDVRSTTILGVRLKGKVAVAGDGQVTLGDMAMKQKAVKVRKFDSSKGGVVGGFAGAAAVEDIEFQKLSFSHNLKTKKWVFKELKDHNISFIPSETNFFLLNFHTKEIAIDALRFLEEKNIFVRGMQPYNLSNYLRVTIGTNNEMKIFLECILSFLKDK